VGAKHPPAAAATVPQTVSVWWTMTTTRWRNGTAAVLYTTVTVYRQIYGSCRSPDLQLRYTQCTVAVHAVYIHTALVVVVPSLPRILPADCVCIHSLQTVSAAAAAGRRRSGSVGRSVSVYRLRDLWRSHRSRTPGTGVSRSDVIVVLSFRCSGGTAAMTFERSDLRVRRRRPASSLREEEAVYGLKRA